MSRATCPAGDMPIAGALAGGSGAVPLSSNEDYQHDQTDRHAMRAAFDGSAARHAEPYPLPTSLKPGGGLYKALTALKTRGLIEERETTDAIAVSRTDGDYRYGLFVTPAGLAAIGIERDGETIAATPKAAEAPKIERVTKTSAVLDLLRRNEGATLADLIAGTGWLPHTTRAALTGLKKKAHIIERGKRGNTTCYFLRAA